MKRTDGITLLEVAVAVVIVLILLALALPALQALRETGRRTQCAFHLRQIAVAIAEYEGRHTHFPAGTINPAGPIRNAATGYHHNWIEGLLPHLDAMAIYQSIDRDVSIYAPANAAPRQTRLSLLKCPSAPQLGGNESNYAGSHHHLETPIDANNTGVFFLNQTLVPDDIEDGLAFTLFVGEKLQSTSLSYLSGTRATLRNTGHPIGDVSSLTLADVVDRERIDELYVGGFASAHPGGAHFVFGDGRVQFFNRDTNLAVLQQLAHRANEDAVAAGSSLDK